jgi:hypothetical protein
MAATVHHHRAGDVRYGGSEHLDDDIVTLATQRRVASSACD